MKFIICQCMNCPLLACMHLCVCEVHCACTCMCVCVHIASNGGKCKPSRGVDLRALESTRVYVHILHVKQAALPRSDIHVHVYTCTCVPESVESRLRGNRVTMATIC